MDGSSEGADDHGRNPGGGGRRCATSPLTLRRGEAAREIEVRLAQSRFTDRPERRGRSSQWLIPDPSSRTCDSPSARSSGIDRVAQHPRSGSGGVHEAPLHPALGRDHGLDQRFDPPAVVHRVRAHATYRPGENSPLPRDPACRAGARGAGTGGFVRGHLAPPDSGGLEKITNLRNLGLIILGFGIGPYSWYSTGCCPSRESRNRGDSHYASL